MSWQGEAPPARRLVERFRLGFLHGRTLRAANNYGNDLNCVIPPTVVKDTVPEWCVNVLYILIYCFHVGVRGVFAFYKLQRTVACIR